MLVHYLMNRIITFYYLLFLSIILLGFTNDNNKIHHIVAFVTVTQHQQHTPCNYYCNDDDLTSKNNRIKRLSDDTLWTTSMILHSNSNHNHEVSLPSSSFQTSLSSSPFCLVVDNQRRKSFIMSLGGIVSSLITVYDNEAIAMDNNDILSSTTSTLTTMSPIDMKLFIDPLQLFIVTVPTRYYVVRRTAKGDLPDEKTGKGRRGSSIFTSGDLTKTQVISIERYPTRILLEENGISVTANDNLLTFPNIGDPYMIANLITIRREKENAGGSSTILSNTKLLRDSVKVKDNGKTLYFMLVNNIAVQKPELLLEQTGLSQLVRITTAKASLQSNDGQLFIIFASALENDYYNSPDGNALQKSIESFIPTDQTTIIQKS